MEQSQFAGAGRLIVIVAMLFSPPRTGLGLNTMEVKLGGRTVMTACLETPPCVAVMVTLVDTATGCVVTVKWPTLGSRKGVVTEAGTEATLGLLLLKSIVVGAGNPRKSTVTVPFDVSVP